MKFICLCYYDPKIANTLSPTEMEALSAACQPHYEAWEKTGKLGALGGLSDPQAWKSIRATDTPDNAHSQPIVSNGPYVFSSQRIGAFFFVEAQDIDEAVAVAAKHPSAHNGRFLGGGIEVCVCESFQAEASAT
ncbi:MAG: YciI family protein [Pseudomonadota bacterium]